MDGFTQSSPNVTDVSSEVDSTPPVPQVSVLTMTQQTPPDPQGEGETQMSPPPPRSTISDHPSNSPTPLEPAVVQSMTSFPHLPVQAHSVTQSSPNVTDVSSEVDSTPPVPQVSVLTMTQQTPPDPQGEGETQMSPPPPRSTISDHPSNSPTPLEPAVVQSMTSFPHLPVQAHSDSPAPNTPSPGSSKVEGKGAAPLSAESKAFRKCSSNLIREIQDPELLAWELYSDEVISDTAVDEVSVVGLSNVQRKMKLLSAVRDQIAVDASKFQNLLLVLRNQSSLKDVADKLKATYDSHCAVDCRETELKDAQRSDDTIPPHASVSKPPITSAEISSSSNAVTDDKHEEQPSTPAADEHLVDEIKKWEGSKNRLVLVTAGKAGMGKSTLVNNLLGLSGEKAAKSKPGAKSVTETVDCYEEEVHGITVRIIDTPGLESKDLSSEEEQEALASLSVHSDGKVDLMLYCMALVGRFDDRDERIVKKLTKAFGKEIWSHAILVLTFGDVVLNQDEGDRELLEGFTNEFEEVLKKAGVDDVPVKSILSIQDDDSEFDSALAKVQQLEIIGIPVGQHTERPQDWAILLFKEIIKKCKIDAIPAMLKVQGITPHWVSEVLRVAGDISVGTAGGVARFVTGAVPGLVVGVLGGVVGAVVGAAFGGVGAIPGAALGAAKGAGIGAAVGVGGGIAFNKLGSGIFEGMKAKRLVEELTGLVMILKARQSVEKFQATKKANGVKAIEEKKS